VDRPPLYSLRWCRTALLGAVVSVCGLIGGASGVAAATISNTLTDTANQSTAAVQNSSGGAIDAYTTIYWIPEVSGCVGVIEQLAIENGSGSPNIVLRINQGAQSFSSSPAFPDPLPTSGTSTSLFLFPTCVNVVAGQQYLVDYDWAEGDGEGVASASVAIGFWNGNGHPDEFPQVVFGAVGAPTTQTTWSPIWEITTGGASGISPFTFSPTSTAAFAIEECAANSDSFVGDISCAFAAAYADVSQALFGLTSGMISQLTNPFADMEHKAPWGYVVRFTEAWEAGFSGWESNTSTAITLSVLETEVDVSDALATFQETETPVGTPREISSYLFAFLFFFYWWGRVTEEKNT